jgi:hypothetical protein
LITDAITSALDHPRPQTIFVSPQKNAITRFSLISLIEHLNFRWRVAGALMCTS